MSGGGDSESTFLSRLIERSSDGARGVEPRVSSLFEPAAPPPVTSIALDQVEPRPLRREAAARERLEPARAATRAGASEPAPEGAHPVAPAPVEPAPSTSLPAVPRLREAAPKSAELTPAVAAERPNLDAALAVSRPSPHPGEAPQPQSAPVLVALAPPPPSAGPRPDTRTASGLPFPPLRAPLEQRLGSETALARRAVASLAPAASASSRGASPTVNVNIGRLEIRAAQPERAPAPAAARGAQPMSLSDYLQQSGGRR